MVNIRIQDERVKFLKIHKFHIIFWVTMILFFYSFSNSFYHYCVIAFNNEEDLAQKWHILMIMSLK